MREKINEENTKQMTIRFPMPLYEEIEKLAIESERTFADQVRFIVKKYLEILK